MDIGFFVGLWRSVSGNERANKDSFFRQLCSVLGVPEPDPKTGDPDRDGYVFERDVVLPHEGGKQTTGWIDLYRKGCFVLEAKSGSLPGSAKPGSARRGTPSWTVMMHAAFGQALGYARTLDDPPPFLVVADLGYCFDLYASFDGTMSYHPFPHPRGSRLYFTDLPKHLDLLRQIWTDPQSLDPSRNAARVTREIAAHLGELARSLEASGHSPERTAAFLIRALFTMFAEDAGLLPEGIFTKALEDHWVESPERFRVEAGALWETMKTGGNLFGFGRIRHFGGSFFADPFALPLSKEQVRLLLEAARASWTDVEPAIFGTLLERALDPRERHRLGAHFTPRPYVERLVRPTVEEPLRAEWDVTRAHVYALVREGKEAEARATLLAFHGHLCKVRVLDPACGTGNFLYVSFDVLKRLESEVLALLTELGEGQGFLELPGLTVTPAQLLGIEVNPRAKEIAELVLWIGFLRWQHRARGATATIQEPILHDYGNIECRDAILAWDRIEPARDEKGEPVTRWDGVTTKPSPVTGEPVPDETARVAVVKHVNPRKAEWPLADYVVGNPPFVGNKRMRAALGDGYVEALRKAHNGVPETADLVMYWWDMAATRLHLKSLRRFGLITTNSIGQSSNRTIIAEHLRRAPQLSIALAVPDHPWVDSADGADVRVAMTVVRVGTSAGRRLSVVSEVPGADGSVEVALRERRGRVHPDLSIGAEVHAAVPLRSNAGISFQGPILVGEGFRLSASDLSDFGLDLWHLPPPVRPYLIGRDITQLPEQRWVIDFFGLEESEARQLYPRLFQRILDRVKPQRDHTNRKNHRERWWLFGEARPGMRRALAGLPRFAVTIETSKHKPFVFLPAETCPDHKLYVIASSDALVLGVLSSRIHLDWALAAGGRLGVGNDPTWTNKTCFLPFPFPIPTSPQAARIRDLGEQLDAHRKRQQALHPGLTITGMYNILEKLRSGETLTAKDKVIHEQGLVSILRQIHDDLDAAVFDAYGWPSTLTDEEILERLVALNAERAEEERRGLVRWLRPELQNPQGVRPTTQAELVEGEGETAVESTSVAPASEPAPWPAALPQQIAAVRDLIASARGPRRLEDVVSSFRKARPKEVSTALESLAALGLALAFDTGAGRAWQAPARLGGAGGG